MSDLYNKAHLDLRQFLAKEDGSEFTAKELEETFDSFIKWMEARNLRGLGSIHYLMVEDVETTVGASP